MKRALQITSAATVSGALFALAIPPGDVQILGWLCFVPLLISLRGARLIFALLAPLATLMFAAYLTTTGVLYSSPNLEGDSAWHYAGFMLYALAVTPAFVFLAAMKEISRWKIFVVAAAFVACESILLVYLPAHLALTQYRSPAMLWSASFIGIWGVSFLLWLFQIGLADGIRRRSKFACVRVSGVAAMFGVVAWLIIAMWEHPEPSGPGKVSSLQPHKTRIGVIQTVDPDFETLGKWNEDAKRMGAEFVVWPELSAAGIAMGGRTERLIELSRIPEQPAFVTTYPDGSKPKPYNAAVLFHAGKQSDPYFKRRPFAGEAQDHAAGSIPAAARFSVFTVGMNICFDSCYPNLMRDTSRLDGVDVIALPCMGPESPYGVIQAIHGAFTPFRSAELGVPIARAETSAFAMITDNSGKIVAQAPPGFQGLLIGDVETRSRSTLAKAFGDWFLYLCWATILIAIAHGVVGAARQRRNN